MDCKLTSRQAEILERIRAHIHETGYPPTRAELARQLGFKSANAAEDHLRALQRKGVIELLPGTSRGIRLIEEQGLPVVGDVAAGHPILAQENIDEHLDVDPQMFSSNADYMLRVRGDSMLNAGICDGDLLAVQQSREARNGQIVVARIEDEVTVKRFRKERSRILLIPENDQFEPIEIKAGDREVTIEGIAVGVIRRRVH